jgi:CheY-like chemotaxis protein
MSGEQFCPRTEDEKASPKPVTGRKNLSTGHQQRAKILIVEDERLIAEDLKEILQNAGHSVVGIFASGEEVLQNINDVNPDLILMDIRLKGSLDGVQTAITIHNTIKTIPIVFLTAHAKNQYPGLNSLSTESFTYLTKPFESQSLLRSIKKMLSSKPEH